MEVDAELEASCMVVEVRVVEVDVKRVDGDVTGLEWVKLRNIDDSIKKSV